MLTYSHTEISILKDRMVVEESKTKNSRRFSVHVREIVLIFPRYLPKIDICLVHPIFIFG